MWDAGNTVRVHVELPGVPKENVRVEIRDGNLYVDGETTDVNDYSTWTSRVRERRYGKYSRVVSLPASIDKDKVDASFNDGILELTIQKTKEAAPKMIPIS